MKVGLIGFGFMGKMHAQAYQQLAMTKGKLAELAAVADAHPENARKSLAQLGLTETPVYTSLAALLDGEEVDVIDVCLPTHMHLEVCLAAIAAGKAIFCEKPLALSSEEAFKIAHAAESAGVPFQVGHVIRFWPEYQELARLADSESLGRLLSLNLQRRAPRPTYASGGWLLDHTLSKGAMLDLHIHDTDYLIQLLGEPEAVTSWGTREEDAGWTHVFTRYHYPDLAVIAEGGWNYPAEWEFRMGFDAVFERGALDYDSTRTPALQLTALGEAPRKVEVERAQAGASRAGVGNIADLGAYYSEIEYFVSCLQRGEQPAIATARQAALSVRVVMAELESAETSETVRVKS
ncbi:MAG: Gfo/Idh/MocA family oxidoreductase [Trueperaceae bacterium]